MARKDVLNPIYLNSTEASVTPISQSLAASFVTVATGIRYLDNIGVQINITTSNSVGTFAIQASVDSINFVPLTLSGTPTANAADDEIVISLNQMPYQALQIAYTSGTAGTGTCTIQIIAKQLGG